MQVGTKSLLIGAHQFIWHPATVLAAWIELYGIPNWKELVCIIIHDWGYWGSPNMDGKEGSKHPMYAALIAAEYLDETKELTYIDSLGIPQSAKIPVETDPSKLYYLLCLHHSRHYAHAMGCEPSKLCWADKLAVKYEPWWLYLPRVILSGEIHEYRKLAHEYGECTLEKSHVEWFIWARTRMIRKAYARDTTPAYVVKGAKV